MSEDEPSAASSSFESECVHHGFVNASKQQAGNNALSAATFELVKLDLARHGAAYVLHEDPADPNTLLLQ
jgi:hypothetical protein